VADSLLQPPIIAAFITLVGAVIIAPAIRYWFFTSRRRLRVTIRHWKMGSGELMKKLFEEEADRRRNASDELKWAFLSFQRVQAYSEVEVENISKKKIENVWLSGDGVSDTWYQINNSPEMKNCEKDGKIALGDIHPRHVCKVHLWNTMSQYKLHPEPKKEFRLSANEIDSVRYRLPLPGYLRWRYAGKAILLFNIFVVGGFFLLFIVAGSVWLFERFGH
jgi:hypothetical protein